MIWSHLRTVLWLRRRTRRNSLRREGKFATVFSGIFTVLIVLASLAMFVLALLIGTVLLKELTPQQITFMWAGLTCAFTVSWCIGVLNDLQLADSVSIDKLLHLPITAKAAFIVNYLSSFLCLSVGFYLPMMLGLAVAHVRLDGIKMLIIFPLIISFFVMITALTFQFRGWFALLMADKRRGRTIVSMVTLAFVLLMQVPYLISTFWGESSIGVQKEYQDRGNPKKVGQKIESGDRLREGIGAGLEGKPPEGNKKTRKEAVAESLNTFQMALKWIPITWTAHGTGAALSGRLGPAFLEILAAMAITLASLTRAYKTTLRIFRGEPSSRVKPKKTDGASADASKPSRSRERASFDKPLLVESKLPRLSDSIAAVALTTLRCLIRAPEARMGLLSSIMMSVFFGGMIFRSELPPSSFPYVLPLLPLGFFLMTVFGISQISANQFGIDRDGFRMYMLAPIKMQDVLFGKNIALVPIIWPMGLLGLVIVSVLFPLPISHFLASVVQLFSIFLLISLTNNLVSILAPMRLASGSIRKNKIPLSASLMHFGLILFLPIAIIPTLFPWGLEVAMNAFGWNPGLPIYLMSSIVLAILIFYFYRDMIAIQGELLNRRKYKILDILTKPSN